MILSKTALIKEARKRNRQIANVLSKRHDKNPAISVHYGASNWKLLMFPVKKHYAVYNQYSPAKACIIRQIKIGRGKESDYLIFMVYDKESFKKQYAVYKKE